MKIVVFDLDETLGYFVEFGIFWDSLNLYLMKNNKKELNQNDFNNILDLYPEFIRPNIINILNYLKNKKKTNSCQKLMIYTNNQGPRKWANYIISYFESKIEFKLVDQVIGAFKINGKRIELNRTTNDKTYTDLISCTQIPVNAEVCFLDDTFYPEMANEKIYYINIKPYIHDLSFAELFERFFKSEISVSLVPLNKKTEFIDYMNKNMQLYNLDIVKKCEHEYQIDKILSKRILHHLEVFFKSNINKNKTRKKHINSKKKINKSMKNK